MRSYIRLTLLVSSGLLCLDIISIEVDGIVLNSSYSLDVFTFCMPHYRLRHTANYKIKVV